MDRTFLLQPRWSTTFSTIHFDKPREIVNDVNRLLLTALLGCDVPFFQFKKCSRVNAISFF